MPDVLWRPSAARAEATQLAAFAGAAPTTPEQYEELWRHSVTDLEGFWARVWEQCGVIPRQGYRAVLSSRDMPGARFFDGAELSFAEHLLRRRDAAVAVIGAGEDREDELVTWAELHRRVAGAQRGLAALGVTRGDRVAGVVPNCVETLVLAIATMSLGAVWSSCSPDFGPMGVVDRFRQIAPAVLVVADGYRYNGTTHPLQDKVAAVLAELPGVQHVVVIPYVDVPLRIDTHLSTSYADLLSGSATTPSFVSLAFAAPLYVLYSSGTTGVPKSIVHGAGGTLVQHLKEQRLHCDIRAGSVVQWFTTCGWMMWNWLVSALASEAAIVLYDGSPTYPDAGALWRLAERAGVTHFGTSPKFLGACAGAGYVPRDAVDLGQMANVLVTGSPMNPEQFDWVYANVAEDLLVASVSGGTDLIGCFVGGVPTLPVRRGRLQARHLGMAVEAWDEDRYPVIGQKGELVCTQPFPSMPLGFWGDDDGARYRSAYFAVNPGVWTHGDFIEIDPDGTVAVLGRSDTTLNPGGVRIGTAEIYRALEPLEQITDAVVISRAVGGDVEVVLCVVLTPGTRLDDHLLGRIRFAIRRATTPRHVPAHVFAVPEVPYTISGKKVEQAVRAVIAGEPVRNRDALANPEALDIFAALPFPA